jgi:hypothetical protein
MLRDRVAEGDAVYKASSAGGASKRSAWLTPGLYASGIEVTKVPSQTGHAAVTIRWLSSSIGAAKGTHFHSFERRLQPDRIAYRTRGSLLAPNVL